METTARAVQNVRERQVLAELWARIQDFCHDREWSAELYIRDDRDQFGRVGAVVYQGDGLSFRAFGDTTAGAIRGLSLSLERDGFEATP